MKDYLGNNLMLLDNIVYSTMHGFRRGKVKHIYQNDIAVVPLDNPGKVIQIASFKVIKI